MKFDYYSYDSDVVIGDTIDKLPLLDIKFSYNPKMLEVKKGKFTGKVYKWIYLCIILFRRAYVLRISFGERIVSQDAIKLLRSQKRKKWKFIYNLIQKI